MKHEGSPLTDTEAKTFEQLIVPLEQELAKRAVDSWVGESRPNPLALYVPNPERDQNGRVQVAPGHITFRGDIDPK